MALSAQVAAPLIHHHLQHQQFSLNGFQQDLRAMGDTGLSDMSGGSLQMHQLDQDSQHLLHLQQQQQHQQLTWSSMPTKFECASSDNFPWPGFSNEFLANNDAYYSQHVAAATLAAAACAPAIATTVAATVRTPPPPPQAPTTASSNAATTATASMDTATPIDPTMAPTTSDALSPPMESDLDAECIGTESLPGRYDLQLRLEERESQPPASFHQRLNASGGSSLWYAIGFHAGEKQIMQRALTTPEEKITKSIVLRNREVLASLWCKELVPVRLFLHGNFAAAMGESQAARLIIRCGAFKQQYLPVKECCVCSDQKHRGGWYGADKRDTNSSKNIPEALQHYWPAETSRDTLHRNSLVIVRNDTCAYHTDSRGRVYAVMPLGQQQQRGCPIELLLYYTCMTTHSHDGTAPNSKDTFTSVQLETLDAQTGRWLIQGRSVFRMRMVTSPERDILNEVTQFLTPAQMGCRMGCGHLESHNTRWQRAKILRTQGQEKLDYYLQMFGSEPGVKKLKAKSEATGSTSDPTTIADDLDTFVDGAAVAAAAVATAAAGSQQADNMTCGSQGGGGLLSLEVSEQDSALVVRGQLLANPESRELVAGALRAYLASLPQVVRAVAAATSAARSSQADSPPATKLEPAMQQQQQLQHQQLQHSQQLQQQQQQQNLGICLSSPCHNHHQGLHQLNSPADSHHSLHCSSAASSVSDHVVYHMQPDLSGVATTSSESCTAQTMTTATYCMPQQAQQAQHQQPPAGMQYYSSVPQGGLYLAAPPPVYVINSVTAGDPATGGGGGGLLPSLQHVLVPHHRYADQQQHQIQMSISRACLGQEPQDQVDGVLTEASMTEEDDASRPQHQQLLNVKMSRSHKSTTSLLRRLAAVKRRRGHHCSLGQLFKAKQKFTVNN